MKKLTQKETAQIKSLLEKFPSKIQVQVNRSADGGFYAEILTFPGCITQADTLTELVDMVNDSLYTRFEVPDKYLSYMPTYMPPARILGDLSVFPVSLMEEKVNFSRLFKREKSTC